MCLLNFPAFIYTLLDSKPNFNESKQIKCENFGQVQRNRLKVPYRTQLRRRFWLGLFSKTKKFGIVLMPIRFRIRIWISTDDHQYGCRSTTLLNISGFWVQQNSAAKYGIFMRMCGFSYNGQLAERRISPKIREKYPELLCQF